MIKASSWFQKPNRQSAIGNRQFLVLVFVSFSSSPRNCQLFIEREKLMKVYKHSFAYALVAALLFTALPLSDVKAQDNFTALQRGYRTGYSDGYTVGYRDSQSGAAKQYKNNPDYRRADRAYQQSHGSLEEYRDGYQQGFEVGYDTGYDRKDFNSELPQDLKRRGVVNQDDSDINDNNGNYKTSGYVVKIPSDSVLVVELLNDLSSDRSQRGDTFQARVLEPREYEGAIIDGTVTNVKRAGKVKGRAEIQLSFDKIRLQDNRQSKMSAQVIEVVPTSDSNVGKVDKEGGVQGDSSKKDDAKKIGTGSAIGAIIGVIAGGGTGAAIGAVIGAGVGAGGVLMTRGKEIHLYRGQQLRIRTAGETRIQ
jgi:hypothetical protein